MAACALSLSMAASMAAGPAAHADPRPGTIEAWQRSTSVSLEADGALSDVQALPTGEVWAVGHQQIWDVWRNRAAIRHWNGTTWAEVPLRDTTGASVLRGVAVAGPREVWAIGDGLDGLPYLARGDASGLDRVTVRELAARDRLGGVYAKGGRVVVVGSRRDMWMVLIKDGSSWTTQVSSTPGALYAVSGAFAVGDTGTRPLVVRHSGGTWKPMRLPDIPGGYLRDVRADGSRHAVAVGGVYTPAGKVEPLVLTWDGKRWSRQALPRTEARLYGVAGDGHGRYWISGFDPARPGEPFLLRLEKGVGTIIRGAPSGGRETVRLQAVTYLPGKGQVWAVGHAVDTADRYTGIVEAFGPRPQVS